MSGTRKRQGNLSVGPTDRANGRKIDTWTFRDGGLTEKDRRIGSEILFDVYMQKTLDFKVETTGIPAERWRPLVGRDLQELHDQALACARAEFDLKNDLTWSEWLEVKVVELGNHERRDAQAGAQATVTYRQIPRAERPDGTAYTVYGNGMMCRFPENVGVAREPDGSPGSRKATPDQLKAAAEGATSSTDLLLRQFGAEDRRDASAQFTYLPDTPENRAGLDSIIRAIEQVNVRLQNFLAADEIGQTLSRLLQGQQGLLTGPEDEAASPPKTRGPR